MTTCIATGERLFTRFGFRDILETQSVGIIQPDPCHTGGISEVLKIGHMAETYYTGIAPHNPYGPVATAACLHLDLVLQNLVIQEMIDPNEEPWINDLVLEPLVWQQGYSLPPTKPGLGVEVDEGACTRSPPDFSIANVSQQTLAHYSSRLDDDSIVDIYCDGHAHFVDLKRCFPISNADS